MDTHDRKKVHLAALKLRGGASAWWDQLEINRAEVQQTTYPIMGKDEEVLKVTLPTSKLRTDLVQPISKLSSRKSDNSIVN